MCWRSKGYNLSTFNVVRRGASLDLVKLAYMACSDAILVSELRIGSPVHYACTHRPSPSGVLEYLIAKSPDALKTTNQFG
jgi:hypothetical protein